MPAPHPSVMSKDMAIPAVGLTIGPGSVPDPYRYKIQGPMHCEGGGIGGRGGFDGGDGEGGGGLGGAEHAAAVV